ncbi:hypothetical protein DRN34_01500 [Thermococci archaeon]|nr:MAG: hypothetical protein DRN34_01500 [Thermococci archaeon]
MFSKKEKRMTDGDFGKAAVMQSLHKMFAVGGHFSICDFDKQAKVMGVEVPKEERDRLCLFHCINWNEMNKELRDEICARVVEVLTGERVELSKNEIIELFAGVDKKKIGGKVYRLLKSGENSG